MKARARELELAAELAAAAGALLRRARADGVRVERKDGGEVVTPADRAADALIRRGLAEEFPGDAVYSEEAPEPPDRRAHQRVWIVDPLDATGSYVCGGDDYAVSIGLAVDGAAAAGVVYVPERDQLFAGAAGGGVRLNGARARTTDRATLAGARLTVSPKERALGLERLNGVPLVPLSSMAHKLARVAAGLDDGAVSRKPRKEWGTCAGVALVLAAGGRATALDGRTPHFNRPADTRSAGLVAAGPRLHRVLLARVDGD